MEVDKRASDSQGEERKKFRHRNRLAIRSHHTRAILGAFLRTTVFELPRGISGTVVTTPETLLVAERH